VKRQKPIATAVGATPADGLASVLSRTEVQRAASSVPGREFVQVRTEIPEGVESGWHAHPGEEVGYILGGTVELHFEGGAVLLLHAGEGFLVPPGRAHNARDVGPGTGQMLSTYLVTVGEPLSTLVTELSHIVSRSCHVTADRTERPGRIGRTSPATSRTGPQL
jgi:quercetin dioxygenase-like cupin family protein